MSMEYVRSYYGVPAKRGGRIEYTGHREGPKLGTITGAEGQYVKIRLDGERISRRYHPTWELAYLPPPPGQ